MKEVLIKKINDLEDYIKKIFPKWEIANAPI